MRIVYALGVALMIAAGVNYWYGSEATFSCHIPIRYSIGQFDDRFAISRSEALEALSEAEAVWEDAVGNDNIFVYNENSPLKVNFIYDERQAEADAATAALNDLDTRGDANEVVAELHAKLVAEYDAKDKEYQTLLNVYQVDLDAYNAEVARYNDTGGAPPKEYERLQSDKDDLDDRRERINILGDNLNHLADRINEVSTKGNELVEEYNQRVNTFNDTFAHNEEFTQGDYQSRQINVYSFTDHRELVLVLAHELGHSLSLDHVADPASIMYYLMGQQPEDPTLSTNDLAAYRVACETGTIDRLQAWWKKMYNATI